MWEDNQKSKNWYYLLLYTYVCSKTHKGSHDDSNRLAPLCCLVCSWFYKRVGYQGSGCQLLLPCQPGADQPRCGGQHHMERPWGSMTLLHHSRKPVCEKYITHYMTILVVSRGRICRESFTSCCSYSLSCWLTNFLLIAKTGPLHLLILCVCTKHLLMPMMHYTAGLKFPFSFFSLIYLSSFSQMWIIVGCSPRSSISLNLYFNLKSSHIS